VLEAITRPAVPAVSRRTVPGAGATELMRSAVAACVALVALGCGVGPAPLPPPPTMPPAPRGEAQCPPAEGQSALLVALARGGVRLEQSAHSVAEAVLRGQAVACWFRTKDGDPGSGVGIFEAAFFPDAASAAAYEGCRRFSGPDQHFLRAGDVIVWTKDLRLFAQLRTVLDATEIDC